MECKNINEEPKNLESLYILRHPFSIDRKITEQGVQWCAIMAHYIPLAIDLKPLSCSLVSFYAVYCLYYSLGVWNSVDKWHLSRRTTLVASRVGPISFVANCLKLISLYFTWRFQCFIDTFLYTSNPKNDRTYIFMLIFTKSCVVFVTVGKRWILKT